MKPSGYFAGYAKYYLDEPLNIQFGQTGYIANPDNSGNGHSTISLLHGAVIVLTLNGDEEITIEKGTPYTDAGAVLLKDNVDISGELTASGSVDVNTVGTYTINYSYQSHSVSRTVIVRSSVIDNNFDFEYTGNIKTFTVPYTGKYKLETWGAQGGNAYGVISGAPAVINGFQGAYSVSYVELTAGTELKVLVGGAGGYAAGRRRFIYYQN